MTDSGQYEQLGLPPLDVPGVQEHTRSFWHGTSDGPAGTQDVQLSSVPSPPATLAATFPLVVDKCSGDHLSPVSVSSSASVCAPAMVRELESGSVIESAAPSSVFPQPAVASRVKKEKTRKAGCADRRKDLLPSGQRWCSTSWKSCDTVTWTLRPDKAQPSKRRGR